MLTAATSVGAWATASRTSSAKDANTVFISGWVRMTLISVVRWSGPSPIVLRMARVEGRDAAPAAASGETDRMSMRSCRG